MRAWVATVPERRRDLEHRLASEDLKDSYAALWELMWRVAAARKWTLAPRAELQSKTPDLLINAPSAFALEVLTVREMWAHRHTAFATELLEALDSVPTDRLWALHITGTVPYTYDIPAAVARFRAGAIETLRSGARRLRCDDAGLVQLEPLPTRPSALTGVHITEYGARWTANDNVLWEKMEQKARAYPPAVLGERSLVIAVCVAPEYGISVHDMANTLFGRVAVDVRATITARARDEHDLQSRRTGGWFLTPNRAHVGAIIFATQVSFEPLTAKAYAFTNPYATNALPLETFLPWPTTRWDVVKQDEASGNWEGTDETLLLR